MTCIKAVVNNQQCKAIGQLWEVQIVVVLHRGFTCVFILSHVPSYNQLLQKYQRLEFWLTRARCCLLRVDSLQGMCSPEDVYGAAGCRVSKLRGYNMFSARAGWRKMTFNNGTGTDAFE